MLRLLRLAALACVLIALASTLAQRTTAPACRTENGACARDGLPACGGRLGPWQVASPRSSAPADMRSRSACVLSAAESAAAGVRSRTHAARPVVAIVPQAQGTYGDTLLSARRAAHAERQRATIGLGSYGGLPDHWGFAVAATFLDDGARHSCDGLDVQPPVNAGYAVIGSNWRSRPDGFYFERLVDACVFDGTRAECAGDAPFIPHHFTAGEAFAVDLALRRDGDTWWLEATVALLQPGADDARAHELGRMQRAVAPPCWLAAGDPGRALVLVIPDHDPARGGAGARVEVFDFAWHE